jgi:hypothetical protein
MSMLPISSIGNLIQAGIVAEAAASQVATSFSDLMEMFTQSIKKKMKTGEEDEDGTKTKTAELNPALLATQGVGGDVAVIQQQLKSLLEKLSSRVQNLLADNNLQAGENFSLSQGVGGELNVGGEHPNSFQIEQILSTDSELTEMFRGIAVRSNLLREIGGKSGSQADSPFSVLVGATSASPVFGSAS